MIIFAALLLVVVALVVVLAWPLLKWLALGALLLVVYAIGPDRVERWLDAALPGPSVLNAEPFHYVPSPPRKLTPYHRTGSSRKLTPRRAPTDLETL